MSRLEKTMANIQALRLKFEGLLETAHAKASAERGSAHGAGLREVSGFGQNPGNLIMRIHVPDRLPALAPLVVALHGCSQTADEYDRGTGWSSLADHLGFAVLYPEQQAANNPKNCFSWFVTDDITRDHGEALSIQQMVEHAIATLGVDRRRVFVTGLSAGGAMACVMLATYPEVFAGGAVIAGLPYGCARSVQQAFEAMFMERPQSAHALGERVRAASNHSGPWPKISIWHGTADPIVKPSNADNIVRQWTDVHGLSTTPDYEESIGNHTRRVWNNADGDTLIEMFSVSGMAHGVPLAATMDEDGCGAVGPFFLETGISSTRYIAAFWGLGDALVESSRAAAMITEPDQARSDSRGLVASAATDAGSAAHDASIGARTGDARPAADPSVVIAAALKAAGLPVPDLPSSAPGTAHRFAPGPIIAAALKAAGLT